jgi:hypothetical protein
MIEPHLERNGGLDTPRGLLLSTARRTVMHSIMLESNDGDLTRRLGKTSVLYEQP